MFKILLLVGLFFYLFYKATAAVIGLFRRKEARRHIVYQDRDLTIKRKPRAQSDGSYTDYDIVE
ncbi:MAG: hypothetical protein ACFCUI_01250 [Bernardetiaceae bacterium]